MRRPRRSSDLATRDAATKQAEDAEELTEQTDKHVEVALTDMQQQLRAILGAVKVKGVGPDGKLHLDTLSQGDIGFGALDALDYNVPQEMPAALKSDAFYAQALSQDTAVMRYADLPLKKPKAAEIGAVDDEQPGPGAAHSRRDLCRGGGAGQGLRSARECLRKLGPIATWMPRANSTTTAEAEPCRPPPRHAGTERGRIPQSLRARSAQAAGFAALVKEAEALLARLPL
jgi:hypothetical protein